MSLARSCGGARRRRRGTPGREGEAARRAAPDPNQPNQQQSAPPQPPGWISCCSIDRQLAYARDLTLTRTRGARARPWSSGIQSTRAMTARKGWARQLVEVVEQRCCGRCRCLSPPPQPPPLASTPAAAAAASRLARSLLAPCRLHLSVQRDILKPVRSEARCAARASSTLVARWSWRWRWRRSFGSRVSVAWWTPHPAGNRLTSIWHAYSSACHTRHALPIVTSRWHLVADPIRALGHAPATHTRSHGSLSLARPTPPHPFERSCTCPATLAQPACQLQHSTPRHTAAASSQQRPSPATCSRRGARQRQRRQRESRYFRRGGENCGWQFIGVSR